MTATNMCSNFGGKWISPPLHPLKSVLFNRNIHLWCATKNPTGKRITHSNPQQLRELTFSDIDVQSTATRGQALELEREIVTFDRSQLPIAQQLLYNTPGLGTRFSDIKTLSGADGYRKVDTVDISTRREEIIAEYLRDYLFTQWTIQFREDIRECLIQQCNYGSLAQDRVGIEDIVRAIQDPSADTRWTLEWLTGTVTGIINKDRLLYNGVE